MNTKLKENFPKKYWIHIERILTHYNNKDILSLENEKMAHELFPQKNTKNEPKTVKLYNETIVYLLNTLKNEE